MKLGKNMAIKICCTGRAGLTQEGIEPHLKEARTLSGMDSNEVIAVEDVYLFNAGYPKHIAVAIVTEYCSRGNLNDYLVQNARTVTGLDKMKFMRQVAFGLLAIHEKGFTHRDIKPENILLTERLNVKIADLGLAKAAWDVSHHLKQLGPLLSGYMTTAAGTLAFAAPEVFSGKPYTNAVDIFSAGLVFVCITCPAKFIVVYGTTMGGTSHKMMPLVDDYPYGKPHAKYFSIPFMGPTGTLGIRKSLLPEMADLIDKMLDEKASERPVIKDVLSALHRIPFPSTPQPTGAPAMAFNPGVSLVRRPTHGRPGRPATSAPALRPPVLRSSKARPVYYGPAAAPFALWRPGMMVPRLDPINPEVERLLERNHASKMTQRRYH